MDNFAEKIDDITIERYDENQELIVEVLDREFLTRGAWTTVVFKFRERDMNTKEWSEPKVRVERYRKLKGVFRSQSRFNLSNEAQAFKLIEVLHKFFPQN